MIDILLTGAVIGSTFFTLFLLTLPSQYDPAVEKHNVASNERKEDEQSNNKLKARVQILVLGDIGQSPRMQYHALSIAKNGGFAEIIGYRESDPHPGLLTNSSIAITPIPPPPRRFQTSNKLLFLLFAPLKVIWQICYLWFILGYRTKPAKWLLLQNPPSLPTLAIAKAMCFLRNTKLIIDWHNFGYSILSLKLGPAHPLVKISKIYEFFFGRNATAHLTVTKALSDVLTQDHGVTSPVLVLHDRPAGHFQPLSVNRRSTVLSSLGVTAPYADSIRNGATKLIISSTSWTPDEDFSLLLDALVDYAARSTTRATKLPNILAVITGKGPQKEYYLSRIDTLKREGKLLNVTILTAWLTIEDYASLLAAADLGVSLHTSSSGVDLPMKVLDMFGAGLPVVGWDKFEAWPELVHDGINGKGFRSVGQLTDLFVTLLGADGTQLSILKDGALREGHRRWDDEWNPIAGRLLDLYTD
ncbi:glycosyltransferase family 33 protein [Xylona heveae TC161]|uniref:Chitobiosyldiphosphodolichol beta-mannosyltransferase n=1 Tax=Xylona heveae (strain CBS 132557 / TC161) TaxID=1328760 RepID=A0A165IKT9_XYLHT|nr:glycosyltransferase family 33 protein [Xylona heveae TC161]KZF25042.1 glycosyltransferase family 33 protein [Xylona heveae TC161]